MKTKIDIEYVEYLQKELSKINKLDINDIEWYENNVRLDMSDSVKEDWKFIGLSNSYFATTRYWEAIAL